MLAQTLLVLLEAALCTAHCFDPRIQAGFPFGRRSCHGLGRGCWGPRQFESVKVYCFWIRLHLKRPRPLAVLFLLEQLGMSTTLAKDVSTEFSVSWMSALTIVSLRSLYGE